MANLEKLGHGLTHNIVKFSAIIGAALLPLMAMTPAANADTRYTPSFERHYHDAWAQWRPRQATPSFEHYGTDANGTVWLNGWSSSTNPHDCNSGCVNSN